MGPCGLLWRYVNAAHASGRPRKAARFRASCPMPCRPMPCRPMPGRRFDAARCRSPIRRRPIPGRRSMSRSVSPIHAADSMSSDVVSSGDLWVSQNTHRPFEAHDSPDRPPDSHSDTEITIMDQTSRSADACFWRCTAVRRSARVRRGLPVSASPRISPIIPDQLIPDAFRRSTLHLHGGARRHPRPSRRPSHQPGLTPTKRAPPHRAPNSTPDPGRSTSAAEQITPSLRSGSRPAGRASGTAPSGRPSRGAFR